MNTRIEQLESQAWEQVNRTNGLVRTEDFNQKFAELIIKECADIANQQFKAATGLDDRDCCTAAEIKRRFGVIK